MRIPPVRIVFSEEDRQQILARIDESLCSGILTLGKNVREFEEIFSGVLGADHAVAVSSGSAAIEMGMNILGAHGKEIIIPTNTFVATAAGVLRAGGIPRFVDTDPETFSMAPEAIAREINENTAGVIVVHIGGIITPRMHDIRKMCDDCGLFLFEDAAHAVGSLLGTESAGTFGHAASFSLYPTKVITSGEGGVLVTGDALIRDEAVKLRDHGKILPSSNVHDCIGSNWRMSEIHAAIGVQHIGNLMEFVEERNGTAAFYFNALASMPGVTPLAVPEGCVSNFYKFIALLDHGIDRAELKRRLASEWEIQLSGEVYEVPCHMQPVFAGAGREPASFPVAEDICARHICLPIYNGMDEGEMYHVAQGLASVLREHEDYRALKDSGNEEAEKT